jgi:hypothetical protein
LSLERAYKDYLILGLIIFIPALLIGIFYRYFTTHDVRLLYLGVIVLVIMLFGVLARYRFFVDYVLTLLRKWR